MGGGVGQTKGTIISLDQRVRKQAWMKRDLTRVSKLDMRMKGKGVVDFTVYVVDAITWRIGNGARPPAKRSSLGGTTIACE